MGSLWTRKKLLHTDGLIVFKAASKVFSSEDNPGARRQPSFCREGQKGGQEGRVKGNPAPEGRQNRKKNEAARESALKRDGSGWRLAT